jgi:NADH-quinone oxidoreductase subunit L
MAARGGALYRLVLHKYWIDEIYRTLLVRPLVGLSRGVLWAGIDRGLIGGGLRLLGAVAQGCGDLLRRMQSGNIRSYAGWLAFGAAIILALALGVGPHLHMGVR